jgi:PAS domain S-box-containing protein
MHFIAAVADQSDAGRRRTLLQDVWPPIGVAIAYYTSAEATLFIDSLSSRVFIPFWLSNTIMFAAFALTPPTHWWRYLLTIFLAHGTAAVSMQYSVAAAAVALAASVLMAVLNASAVRRWCDQSSYFGSLKSAAAYVVAAVAAGPMLAALVGAWVPILNSISIDSYAHSWLRWCVSNALSMTILGTLLLMLFGSRDELRRSEVNSRIWEAILIVVLLAGASFFAFSSSGKQLLSGYASVLLYLPLPLVLWAATRYGAFGAAGSMLVLSTIFLARSLDDGSPFDAPAVGNNIFALQIFLIGISAPALLLGSAINEIRDAERIVRQREERMSFAAESADVGLWIYRFLDGEIWMTDHARRMLGLQEGALTVSRLLSVVHPSDVNAIAVSLKTSIKDREAIDVEFRLRNESRETRWFSMRARPHFDVDNTASEMGGTLIDISQRKKAEHDAAEQRKEITHLMRVSMLGELSGGLAHELTQPLTAILSNAEAGRMILARPRPDLYELVAILEDIIRADERAGEVIHRIRTLLKKGETRYEAVDLNHLIESTLALLHSELINRKVTVRQELSAGLAAAHGDAVQLQQVLLNLLLNAIEAMEDLPPSRRVISVTTSMNGIESEIRVSDRGSGLSVTEEESFKPFFTTKRRGLGLGLVICGSIAKSHGGTLSLRNNPGEGAIAIFRLPSCQME